MGMVFGRGEAAGWCHHRSARSLTLEGSAWFTRRVPRAPARWRGLSLSEVPVAAEPESPCALSLPKGPRELRPARHHPCRVRRAIVDIKAALDIGWSRGQVLRSALGHLAW